MPELRRGTCDHRPNPRYVQQDDDEEFVQGSSRLGMVQLLKVALAPQKVPCTFAGAMVLSDSLEWLEACQYEIDALAKHGVWSLVDRPADRKVVKNCWVFNRKADGSFCARLVAKGFTQVGGL